MPLPTLIDAVDILFHYALGDVAAAVTIRSMEDDFTGRFDPQLLLRCSYCFLLWARQEITML